MLAVTLGLTRYTYVNPDAFLQAIHPYVEPDAYMMKNEKTSEDYPRLKITFEDKSSKFPQVENSLEIYGIVDAVNYLLEHFSGTTTLNQILTTVKLKNSIKN